MTNHFRRIPLWFKMLYTLYTCVAVGVNCTVYGPANFLWFSDIALIVTVAAIWLESSLLASMMAVATVLPETGWAIAFFSRLVSGVHLGGVTGYMFRRGIPLDVRAISLFHLFLPALLLWIIYRLGYDRRALLAQCVLSWFVYLVIFFFTSKAEDINWAFGPGTKPQDVLPTWAYLLLVIALLNALIYAPTHWLLARLFTRAHRRPEATATPAPQ